MERNNQKEDVLFVILGATGDLSKRKLIPAIYHLVKDKKIGRFAILGISRSPITSEELLHSSKKFISRVEKRNWKKMEKSTYYQTHDFYKKEDYLRLKKKVQEISKKHHLSGNKLFYLSTLPQHFDTITSNLSKSGLSKSKGWNRVVYEKPFGHDLESAKKINQCICRVFKEDQVYRIDHYLGKELVGNMTLLRFTNRVLEPLWNNQHVESVQITLNEEIGIEDRGNFYDRYGALKDVVQNHMLQLLALTAMDAPKKLVGEYIREEKSKVLKKIKVHKVLRGQYKGYLQEKGVKKSSKTETFAALHLEIKNKRWEGVPFFLRTGKKLRKKETTIHIKFKPAECLLPHECPQDSNYLTLRIQPDEGFHLKLFAKKPGKINEVTPVKMDFCHSCLFKLKTPEAYETLLDDVIRGDQSLFVRNDEIESSWKVIDNIEKIKSKIYLYTPGSIGPKELIDFSREHKMRWIL